MHKKASENCENKSSDQCVKYIHNIIVVRHCHCKLSWLATACSSCCSCFMYIYVALLTTGI